VAFQGNWTGWLGHRMFVHLQEGIGKLLDKVIMPRLLSALEVFNTLEHVLTEVRYVIKRSHELHMTMQTTPIFL